MHVQHTRGAGAFVQVVHVLRDHDDVELLLERRDRQMRGIGLRGPGLRAPLVVEGEHQLGMFAPAFGAGELDPGVLPPQSRGIAKGRQAALGRKAGARQDHDLLRHRAAVTAPCRGRNGSGCA